MIETILVLLILAVAYLWLKLNERRVSEFFVMRNKTFTVFRAYFLDGRYADFVALDNEERNSMRKEMDMHIATQMPFSAGGPITRYEEIAGKDHDGRWVDPTPPVPGFDWREVTRGD